jgi:hypothetical protein
MTLFDVIFVGACIAAVSQRRHYSLLLSIPNRVSVLERAGVLDSPVYSATCRPRRPLLGRTGRATYAHCYCEAKRRSSYGIRRSLEASLDRGGLVAQFERLYGTCWSKQTFTQGVHYLEVRVGYRSTYCGVGVIPHEQLRLSEYGRGGMETPSALSNPSRRVPKQRGSIVLERVSGLLAQV